MLTADARFAGHLRRALAAAGFEEPCIARELGLEAPLRIAPPMVPVLSRRLRGAGALQQLIRLFLLGETLEEGVAAEVLGAENLEPAVSAGLIERTGNALRACVQITPFRHLLVAHDPLEEPFASDHVPGFGPSTRTLAGLTVRRQGGSALDVGTGSGIQALLAAGHCRRVVAVDINQRALEFARFNAALNGIDNIEFREGSFFEPVEGERFDLIVANPPYVISPDRSLVFRDGGQSGDALSRFVVRASAEHLAVGGFATVLCNWVANDEPTASAPARWVAGAGCDAWVLTHQTEDALDYAARWNELTRGEGESAFAGALDRWMASYDALGIRRIATGVVILHRREGENWVRCDAMPHAPSGEASSHIERVFAAGASTAGLKSGELLGRPVRLVGGHRLEQVLVRPHGAYEVSRTSVFLDEGVGLPVDIEPLALHAILRLDTAASLAEAIAHASEETGLDRGLLEAATLRAVRELLALGFLVDAGGASG